MTDTLTAERELDALICDFQVACEECVERSNSETMMERAILRNALRSKLLAATARITALEAALDSIITALRSALAAERERDNPEWDGTDAAHPAWWRGNDRGVEAVVEILTKVLDGGTAGAYGSASLTALAHRLAAERAAGAEVVMKHRRHVELSPGVGANVQRYALAVLDDVLADFRRRALAADRETEE